MIILTQCIGPVKAYFLWFSGPITITNRAAQGGPVRQFADTAIRGGRAAVVPYMEQIIMNITLAGAYFFTRQASSLSAPGITPGGGFLFAWRKFSHISILLGIF